MPEIVILNDRTRFGGETGAGLMRNRCAFTSKDMAAEWDSAFTYAIVYGWSGAWSDLAERYGWDDELVTFLRKSHREFKMLADKVVADA
jgi:hypothetical protein